LERTFRLVGRTGGEEVGLLFATVTADAPRPHRHLVRADGGIGGGKVEQAHLRGAEGDAGIVTERGGDAEVVGGGDHLVDADRYRQARRGYVVGVRECVGEGDAAMETAVEILWLPAFDVEGRVV